MIDDAACGLVAQELREALRTRLPIDPIRRSHPGLTVDDAYTIQLSQVATWQRDGQQVQGHKVGLTSAAMQRKLGADQPDYGHLYETMFHLEGLPIALGEFISPKVEPEIAFVLKRPLAGPGVNVTRALSAIDYVVPRSRSSARGSVTGISPRARQHYLNVITRGGQATIDVAMVLASAGPASKGASA